MTATFTAGLRDNFNDGRRADLTRSVARVAQVPFDSVVLSDDEENEELLVTIEIDAESATHTAMRTVARLVETYQ